MIQAERGRRAPELRHFTLPGGGLRLPYHGTIDLERPPSGVGRVVVVVHGTERNGARAYRTVLRAARRGGDAVRRTAVIAPQFLGKRDAREGRAPADAPYWSAQGWKEGNRSTVLDDHPRPSRITSFAALDAVLERLAVLAAPDGLAVVLVGHSAGAQFVQRYAAASDAEAGLRAAGASVEYVVANPSSYLYLGPERADGAGGFAPPPEAERAACPDWDTYKYGLADPNAYVGRSDVPTIRRRYAGRAVVYLLGERDASPRHKDLDRTRAARLQGRHRLERGLIFHAYLKATFGPGIAARHRVRVVAGVGHDAARMFRSPEGLLSLFGPEAAEWSVRAVRRTRAARKDAAAG